jgi:hypothetical protein
MFSQFATNQSERVFRSREEFNAEDPDATLLTVVYEP